MNKNELIYFFSKFKYSMQYMNFSFSQEGEDIVIDRLLDYKQKGFYIDLGAHHPIRFSNTLKFYVRGWKGLNIDAMPGSMQKFDKLRPRDINIEAGISDNEATLQYYDFKEKALNTFDDKLADSYIQKGYELNRKIDIKTYNVNTLFQKYLPQNQMIDFIDIDIEGFDQKIVSSIDWNTFRPTLVLVETFHAKNNTDEIISFPQLLDSGYTLVAKTGLTCIYYRPN